MNLPNFFRRRSKKSSLKKHDFNYTEESHTDKTGKQIIHRDYDATGWVWNTEVHICFSEHGIDNVDDFIEQLNERIDLITESKERIEKGIIEQLFTLRNETWIEHDDDLVTEQEFLQRLRPTHLTISSDLSYDLRFDDGDLFWGHTILYHADPSNNNDGVGLEG